MKSAYIKYLNILTVITLMFAPVDIMYANNSTHTDAREMVADVDQTMQPGEKCHQDMTAQIKDSQCCCDSEANQCACVVHLTTSLLMPDHLDILNSSSGIRFVFYPVNHIQNYTSPLFKPPIA